MSRQERTRPREPKSGAKTKVHASCGRSWEEHRIKGRSVIDPSGAEWLITKPQWVCP